MTQQLPSAPKAAMPTGFTDFDRFFNRMMRRWPPFDWPEFTSSAEPQALRAFEHVPNVEVKENGKHYTVSVELPGLDEKDVKASVEDDVLTISGEKKVERTDEKTHFSERSYGSFTRSFTLARRRRPQRRFGQVRQGRPDGRDRQDHRRARPGQADRHQGIVTRHSRSLASATISGGVGEQQWHGEPSHGALEASAKEMAAPSDSDQGGDRAGGERGHGERPAPGRAGSRCRAERAVDQAAWQEAQHHSEPVTCQRPMRDGKRCGEPCHSGAQRRAGADRMAKGLEQHETRAHDQQQGGDPGERGRSWRTGQWWRRPARPAPYRS